MLRRSAIKPKPRKRPEAAERRHMDRLAQMGCLVCGANAEIHHVHSDGFQRLTRTHKRAVPLCPPHHRTGQEAVHVMSHAGFNAFWWIDLLAEADRLWAESEEMERA